MKICKFNGGGFRFSQDENFDIDEKGRVHSWKGIWEISSAGENVCHKFETDDEQFKNKQGFFFCNMKTCKKCIFYEEVEV